MTTRYLRGDVIDQIFARIGAPGGATELNWLLQDRLGSIREVRNASGGAIRNVDYDGFGNVLGTAPAELGRYTWTGRERDVEIDLQYNRARYYDPATGRWIHRDPLGFDAGDSNLYRYVNNGPTNGTDPSGLAPPMEPPSRASLTGVPPGRGGFDDFVLENYKKGFFQPAQVYILVRYADLLFKSDEFRIGFQGLNWKNLTPDETELVVSVSYTIVHEKLRDAAYLASKIRIRPAIHVSPLGELPPAASRRARWRGGDGAQGLRRSSGA